MCNYLSVHFQGQKVKVSYVYLIIGFDLGFDCKIGTVKYTEVSYVLKHGGMTNIINRFVYFFPQFVYLTSLGNFGYTF